MKPQSRTPEAYWNLVLADFRSNPAPVKVKDFLSGTHRLPFRIVIVRPVPWRGPNIAHGCPRKTPCHRSARAVEEETWDTRLRLAAIDELSETTEKVLA